MANTYGHTMRRYEGHKLYLANIARRKAAPLADNGLDLDVAPFWTACPPRGCDCADCAYEPSYSDSWDGCPMSHYEMSHYEMSVADYFAERDSWGSDEAYYQAIALEADRATAEMRTEGDRLVVTAWLQGAAF